MRRLIESGLDRILSALGLAKDPKDAALQNAADGIRPEFDVSWYLARYPEVAELNIDPVLHYVMTGAESGYDPHPEFSTSRYLDLHEDVRQVGMHPFLHWLQHGRPEGRRGGPGRNAAEMETGPGGLANTMFSVVLACGDRSGEHVSASLDSVAGQQYRNFEVILLGQHDLPRVGQLEPSRGLFCEPSLDRTDVLTSAGGVCWRGDYLMMLEAGDRLDPRALAMLNASVDTGSGPASILLFDHAAGRPGRRRCLPGLDLQLLAHDDYLRSACAVSRQTILRDGGKGSGGLPGIVLRAAQQGASWRHVPEVLLHQGPAWACKPYGLPREPDVPGGVSVIIPNRNRPDLLRSCTRFVSGLGIPFQLILVDNGSTDPEVETVYGELERELGALVLRIDHAFNYSRMVNAGAAAAVHECLLLLNNDVVIERPEAVLAALGHVMRPAVGVVGSVLRYPDGGVQHAGMVFWQDPDGMIRSDHVLRHAVMDERSSLGALTAPRSWQAVTGAFQVIRKSVFDRAGGYDESNLPIEYNDVDFCFRVRAMGLQVVCLPLPGIVHDESTTRGTIDAGVNARMLARAHAVMKARWLANFMHDPFLHPQIRMEMGHDAPGHAPFGGRVGRPATPPLLQGGTPWQRGSSPDAWAPRRLAPGVCILGFLNSEIGLGEAARNLGRACDAARLPSSHVNRPLPGRSNEPVFESFFQRRADRVATLSVEGLTPEGYHFDDAGSGRIQILYPFWELPSIPAAARAMLDRYDELWAASEFIAAALREASKKLVRVIPQPLAVPELFPDPPPRSDRVRFLTYFDYDSYIERKNPLATIAAFRAAFDGRRNVELIVKARGLGSDVARQRLAEAVNGDRRIRIIDATISRREMTELLAGVDAFVSLHRAEGFGFGAAEALAAGRAVIATAWSGTSDFVTQETGFPVDYRLRAVGSTDYVHAENQVWADPLIDSAVAQMRAVADDPEAARHRARRGHELLLKRNSFAAVGREVARALREIGAI